MRATCTIPVIAVAAVLLWPGGSSADRPRSVRLYFEDRGFVSVVRPDETGVVRRLVEVKRPAEVGAITARGKYLFWTVLSDRGALYRANRDGTHVRLLVSGLGVGLGVVAVGHYVYWLSESAIGRADISGTDIRRRFIAPTKQSGGDVGEGLATDGQYLYFTRCDDGSIARVGLNGSNLDERFINLSNQCPLGLTYADGFLYWTDTLGPGAAIDRATVASRRVQRNWLTVDEVHSPYVLAAGGQRIYWSWGGAGGSPDYIGQATVEGKIVKLRFLRGDVPSVGS